MRVKLHLRFLHHRGEVDGAVAVESSFDRREETQATAMTCAAAEQEHTDHDDEDDDDD